MSTVLVDHSPIAAAVRAIAARCDGAHQKDGQGFAAADTAFGKNLAALPDDLWTPEMARAAWEMLRTYKGQLHALGVTYNDLPVPPEPGDSWSYTPTAKRQAKRAERRVTCAGPVLSVRFPYDPDMVAAVKALPGRKWDGASKCWTVPLAAAPALARIAGDEFLWDDASREAATAPQEAPTATNGSTGDAERVLRRDGARWVLVSPYDPGLVKAVKAVDGARWSKDDKVWTFPATSTAAAGLLKLLEPWRITTDDLGALKAAGEAVAAKTALSKAVDADVDLPGFGMDLFGFQRAGVAYAADARRTFIADETGLGKTRQGLGTAHALDAYPLVVVTLAKTRVHWCQEALEAWPDRKVALIVPAGTPPGQVKKLRRRGIDVQPGVANPGADVYVVAYHGLPDAAASLALVKPKGLILDEGQMVKTRDRVEVCRLCGTRTKRKACPEHGRLSKDQVERRYAIAWVEAAWRLSRAIPADGMVVDLSATPHKNGNADLVAQLDILGRLDDFGGEWPFLIRYCGARKVEVPQRGGGSRTVWELGRVSPERNAELHEKLRATCWVRRTKKDVRADFPDLLRAYQTVELSAEGQREYDAAEADLVEWCARRAAEIAVELGLDPRSEAVRARLRVEAAEHLVRSSTLRRLAATGKIEAAEEWVAGFLEGTDRKLLVFAHHNDVVDALAGRFGAPKIDGTTTAIGTAELVERFQTDPECRVVVIGIMAGGAGLTLTAAEDMLFLEQAWTPGDLIQAFGRCYGRLNDMHGATATFLIGAGTLDEDMRAMLAAKWEDFDLVADGRRMTDADGAAAVVDRFLPR